MKKRRTGERDTANVTQPARINWGLVCRQILGGWLVALLVSGLVTGVWWSSGESLVEAFGKACLGVGIVIAAMGVFSIGAGGLEPGDHTAFRAMDKVVPFVRARDELEPNGLTVFGLSLATAIPLLFVGAVVVG